MPVLRVIRNFPSLVVAGLSLVYFLAYPLAIGRADESHLLLGARRVLEGEVIYEDFYEILTPLSFYLFAGVFWIGGTTLLAARVVIALIEAAGCALLFHLVRRVAGLPEAVLVTLIFAGICIPTWPFASPHWISTTLALLVATMTLAERWQASARFRPLVAGVLTGVAICVQQQRSAFLAVWLVLALSLLCFSHARPIRWRMLGTEIAWAMGATTIVVLVVLGHAAWRSSPATLVDRLYGHAATLYGPSHSLRFAWASVVPFTEAYLPPTWMWLLRISPLFVVGDGLLLLWDARRAYDRRDLERAALWLLALLMGLSVWYLPDFIHVSFVLPFLLIPGAVLLHRLRSASMWIRFPVSRHAVTVGVSLFILAVVGKSIANLAYAYTAAPVRLETGFGVVRVDALMGQLFHGVRNHLVREPDGRNVLWSYPDDAWLYLVLPADNATAFSLLYPGMYSVEHFQQVRKVLQARRPGTVVTWPEKRGGIPKDIERGYDLVDRVGPYLIYNRRASPTPPGPGAHE